MPLGTNDDLLRYVEDTFGVRIPRTRCCAAHRTPAEAFCDSYFARAPVTVWNASRAFGGKTFLLSLLALTEALTLEVSVTVLGGSGQQSARVLDAMGAHWRAPAAPVHLLDGPPGLYTTRLIWGNTITALTASQTSVRGAHPARLRLDEADEMRLPILEAAQGQPMDQGAVRAQTVIASTHQHPDGTMTAVLQSGGRAGLARLRMVLSGNARTPRVADRGPGYPQAHRNHGPDVAHGIRPPGTERGGTGDRSGCRGVGLRRRPRRGRRGRARPRLGGNAHDGGGRQRPAGTPTAPTGRRPSISPWW